MLVFFTNVSPIDFQVKYLTLFHLFLVVDDLEWFWIRRLHKNAGCPQVFILCLTFSLIYINELSDDNEDSLKDV